MKKSAGLLLFLFISVTSCKKKATEECVTCIELNNQDTANEYCASAELVDQYIAILKANEDSTHLWFCTKH